MGGVDSKGEAVAGGGRRVMRRTYRFLLAQISFLLPAYGVCLLYNDDDFMSILLLANWVLTIAINLQIYCIFASERKSHFLTSGAVGENFLRVFVLLMGVGLPTPLVVDTFNLELTNEEMTAVKYVEHLNNIDPKAEVVKINGSFGELTLNVSDMNCLIRPPRELGKSKWIDAKVINCYINIMDPNRHGCLKVMAVSTFSTSIYARCNTCATKERCYENKGREFLNNDLVFFPINYGNEHWFVGVLNKKFKQFQILDSKFEDSMCYDELTQDLRKGIQCLINLALEADNLRDQYSELDITKWSVVVIETPQQKDDHSCGLFVLKYIELWNGSDKWNDSVEIKPDLFRIKLVPQLILSEKNELKNVQTLATTWKC